MTYLSAMWWRNLLTPEDFRDKPYVGQLNQIGHWALGLFATTTFLCVWYAVAGEMPARWWVFLIVFSVYAVGIELILQRQIAEQVKASGAKWTLRDSFWDSTFYAWGCSIPLVPFFEVKAEPMLATVEFRVDLMLGLFAGTVVWFLLYAWDMGWFNRR